MIFRNKDPLWSSLMKTRPERDPQQTAQHTPVAFLVNVAEATLPKQAGLYLCSSMRIHIISRKSSRKI
jgi:hypothetical protein